MSQFDRSHVFRWSQLKHKQQVLFNNSTYDYTYQGTWHRSGMSAENETFIHQHNDLLCSKISLSYQNSRFPENRKDPNSRLEGFFRKRIQAKSRLKPSLMYRFRRLLTMFLMGLVIFMLEMEFAMTARRAARRSAAALAPRFFGTLRSTLLQLAQTPIK